MLGLLSRLSFDAALRPDDVVTTGITGVGSVDVVCARALGGSVKLVAQATLDGEALFLSVRPTLVLAGHALHGVDDADNAVVIVSDLAGRVMLSGLGGGGDSTASAVVSDIVASVRAPHQPPRVPTRRPPIAGGAEIERAAYIRVRLVDVAEAAPLVTQALEDRGIPVVATAPARRDGAAQLAVLTGQVTGDLLEHAADTLDSLAVVAEVAAIMDAVGPS